MLSTTVKVIALAGGIGSGKSVVSNILAHLGYTVVDCDSLARQLMDDSDEIKSSISRHIDPIAILPDGSIDRRRLASIVFSDSEKLKMLNHIVHAQVRAAINSQIRNAPAGSIIFIETAILYESEINKLVDKIWIVDAKIETRINRVIQRNGLTRQEVESRIDSQQAEMCKLYCSSNCHIIINDNNNALLPQILHLISEL